jgi:hypothetical protein
MEDKVAKYFENGVEGWEHKGYSGFLNDFLDTFDILRESQVLVYSKTSFQASKIRPENPRAIFFNKDIYTASSRVEIFLRLAHRVLQQETIFIRFQDQEPILS